MVKANVMVVEDNGLIALSIQRTLRNLGYAVPAVAASGEEAIRQALALRPDLVLMDSMLEGDMDGILSPLYRSSGRERLPTWNLRREDCGFAG